MQISPKLIAAHRHAAVLAVSFKGPYVRLFSALDKQMKAAQAAAANDNTALNAAIALLASEAAQ